MKRTNIKKITFAIILASVMALGVFVAPKTAYSKVSEKGADVITVISPTDGSTAYMDNENVKDFFGNYALNYSKNFYGKGEILPMAGVTLEWAFDGGKYYNVYVDSDESFSNPQIYTCINPKITINNLTPNVRYYWKVTASAIGGERKTSRAYSFIAQAYVRSVNIDGVSNVRDLGGAVTSDGKTIKYGVVYRSAALEKITEKGKREVFRLGIKTDLDLRGSAVTVSPIGERVKKINVNAPWYAAPDGPFGINGSAEYVQGLVDEFKVCAEPSNYPMLFHCAIGRDRTGTLAAILLAVCGVSREDIVRDYELSWFSVAACNDSAMQVTRINQLCDFLDAQGGETFQEKTIGYLLSIGITEQDVASVKSILVG